MAAPSVALPQAVASPMAAAVVSLAVAAAAPAGAVWEAPGEARWAEVTEVALQLVA